MMNYGKLYTFSLKLIYSYRIEQAMAIRMLDNQYKDQDIYTENEIYKELICAVDIQRKAIKLVSIHDTIYIFVIFYFFKVFRIFNIQLCRNFHFNNRNYCNFFKSQFLCGEFSRVSNMLFNEVYKLSIIFKT